MENIKDFRTIFKETHIEYLSKYKNETIQNFDVDVRFSDIYEFINNQCYW